MIYGKRNRDLCFFRTRPMLSSLVILLHATHNSIPAAAHQHGAVLLPVCAAPYGCPPAPIAGCMHSPKQLPRAQAFRQTRGRLGLRRWPTCSVAGLGSGTLLVRRGRGAGTASGPGQGRCGVGHGGAEQCWAGQREGRGVGAQPPSETSSGVVGEGAGVHWKRRGGGSPPPRPGRACSLRPATVPLTPSASQ